MFRTIMIGGVTAAVIVGAGGTALAVSGDNGSGTTSGSGSSTTSHAKTHDGKTGKAEKKGHRLLRRVDHAEIVLHTKKGFVTRQLIKGTVTDVSSTSITVASKDKTTETFQVTKNTKVRTRTDGKPAASSIDKVTKGDRVFVGGLGADKPVAARVAYRAAK